MQKQFTTEVPAQNFAVAPANAFRQQAGLSAAELLRLAKARSAAWNRWWRLYSEPDVWTQPEKRRAMCSARLEYHDAFFALALALKQRGDR